MISTNEDVHSLTDACEESPPLYKVHSVHARTLTHTTYPSNCTETTVAGSWYRGCAYGLDEWYMSLSPSFRTFLCRSSEPGHSASADPSDALSCGAWTSSGLQTAEVSLSQHSVDVVVGDTAAVAMETMLQRAGRVFRLWAGRALREAVALGVRARAGPNQQRSFGIADSVTAVVAGRL